MEFTGIKKKQTVYTAIAELEELGLIEALKETDNNQSKAAELLELDRSSLRRIISRK